MAPSARESSHRRSIYTLGSVEAILASDLWHSSGAFVGGLLLQTSTLLISVGMLRGSAFSKATAWAGIAAHGLDLAHIVALPFLPSLAVTLMAAGGTLYLAWFPLLARDFSRLARE